MSGHFQVTRVSGEFVGAQHLGADNGAQVQLAAPGGIALAVGLAAGGCADGKERPVGVRWRQPVIQYVIHGDWNVNERDRIAAVLVISGQPFDDAPGAGAQIPAHPIRGWRDNDGAVGLDAPVRVVDEIGSGHDRFRRGHPGIPFIDVNGDVEALIQLPVQSPVPRRNHALLILDDIMRVIRREGSGGEGAGHNGAGGSQRKPWKPGHRPEWPHCIANDSHESGFGLPDCLRSDTFKVPPAVQGQAISKMS